MVVVLSAEDIDVECHTGRHGEGVKYVREHLRGEVAYFLTLDAEVTHAVWTGADIDDRTGQSL